MAEIREMVMEEKQEAEQFHNRLSGSWWFFVARGLTAVLFGAVMLLVPERTVLLLSFLTVGFVVTYGLITLTSASLMSQATDNGLPFLAEALVGLAAGGILLFIPNITPSVLVYLVVAWSVLTGISELAASTKLQKAIEYDWLPMLGGAISLTFGVALFMLSGRGPELLGTLIGIEAILFGLIQVALGLALIR